jgi:hypothetical protein
MTRDPVGRFQHFSEFFLWSIARNTKTPRPSKSLRKKLSGTVWREAGKSVRKNGTDIPVKRTKNFYANGTLDNQPRCRTSDQNKNR